MFAMVLLLKIPFLNTVNTSLTECCWEKHLLLDAYVSNEPRFSLYWLSLNILMSLPS